VTHNKYTWFSTLDEAVIYFRSKGAVSYAHLPEHHVYFFFSEGELELGYYIGNTGACMTHSEPKPWNVAFKEVYIHTSL
jgi:hypothetical protein